MSARKRQCVMRVKGAVGAKIGHEIGSHGLENMSKAFAVHQLARSVQAHTRQCRRLLFASVVAGIAIAWAVFRYTPWNTATPALWWTSAIVGAALIWTQRIAFK